MNKIKQKVIIASMTISLLVLPTLANASSYTVKEGDSFWLISSNSGVTLSNLQLANNRVGNSIYPGETIEIPNEISHKDKC